jgi:glutamine---fructose-6-phosphate transaminase (isomerizing)
VNLMDYKYSRYALVREMMETVSVIKKFDAYRTSAVSKRIKKLGKLLLTGEGSSRIFPAKNCIRKAHSWGLNLNIITEGALQAARYKLSDYAVFCASNSGRTKEVITLAEKLITIGNENRYALTANNDTVLESKCGETFILGCGWEKAVAATKSVIEQALFYESILWNLSNKNYTVLTMPIDQRIIDSAVKSPIIYFSGYNDGVAEELTLKTNEITRKKSDFLEGTYAVHGIEEVLEKEDIIFLIDPIEEEIEKLQKVLVDGIGLNVVAVSTKNTPFNTIIIPDAGEFNPYLFLCAGWNLLVEIGLRSGINLDKPKRARKVGNEVSSK